jgi:hypothetical protein
MNGIFWIAAALLAVGALAMPVLPGTVSLGLVLSGLGLMSFAAYQRKQKARLATIRR